MYKCRYKFFHCTEQTAGNLSRGFMCNVCLSTSAIVIVVIFTTPHGLSVHHHTMLSTKGTLCTLSHPVAVRLAGGSSEAKGRVEVYIRGDWGTVCGYSWDPLDSKVVCQQLGYKGVKQTYSRTSQHSFGRGTGQSLLRDLLCTGSEANLLQCPHGGVGSGCSHSRDVGVVCTKEDLPGKGEWMWVRRRKFQCTVNLI